MIVGNDLMQGHLWKDPDLARGGRLPLDARQILGAAQAAWVFGGMGSWNDLGFEGHAQDEYTALSDELFSLLNQAICEAANSGFAASSDRKRIPPTQAEIADMSNQELYNEFGTRYPKNSN